MLGSKTAAKADQYSKLIDLVSTPEALTKRLEELKQATQYHEDVYQKAMLAKEQAEDANKNLNERANILAAQLKAREDVVAAREKELEQGLESLNFDRTSLNQSVVEFANEMKFKEAGFQAGVEEFEKREAESKKTLEEIRQKNANEYMGNIEKLATQAQELDRKRRELAEWEKGLEGRKQHLDKRESKLTAFAAAVTEAAKEL